MSSVAVKQLTEDGPSGPDCGTGKGGFKVGNTCATGGGAGTGNRGSKMVFSSHDDDANVETVESSGVSVVNLAETVKSDEYFRQLKRAAADAGIGFTFEDAVDAQSHNGIELEDEAVWFYQGDYFRYFTKRNIKEDDELYGEMYHVIDDEGKSYGTISPEARQKMQDDMQADVPRLWREHGVDEVSAKFENWDDLPDNEKNHQRGKWEAKEFERIDTEIAEKVVAAREKAVAAMKEKLEEGAAASRLNKPTLLYRGLTRSGQQLDELISQGYIANPHVSSWTTDVKTAGSFSRSGRGVYKIVLVLQDGSVGLVNTNNMEEQEVIRPPAKNKIERVTYLKDAVMVYVREDSDYAPSSIEESLDCGTGKGGFKVGNTCAKRGPSGEIKVSRPLVVPIGDIGKGISTIETAEGPVEVIDMTDLSTAWYSRRLHDAALADNLKTSFHEAEDLQQHRGIDVKDPAVLVYQGSAYHFFTNGDMTYSYDVDTHGESYGALTMMRQATMAQEAFDEIDKQWELYQKAERQPGKSLFGKTEEEVSANKVKWIDARKYEAERSIREKVMQARRVALEAMKGVLERGVAESRIGCCLQIYRGLGLTEDQYNQMIASGRVAHKGVNSWTLDNSTASFFSTDGDQQKVVILVMQNPRVGLVNSSNKDEAEIIRPPASQKIKRIVKTETGAVVYIDEDEDY